MRKCCVAILGPAFPSIGGIATHVENLFHSSLKDAYSLIFIRTMSRKHGHPDYIIEKVWTKIFRILNDLSVLNRILLTRRPDLVHINSSLNTGAFWRDALYMLSCKLFRRKILLQLHGGHLNDFISCHPRVLVPLIRWILHMPVKVAVLSKLQKEPFTELYLNSHLSVIPNMIRHTEYRLKGNFRDEFGFFPDKVIVVFMASHLTKEKGVMEFLHAAASLIRHNGSVHFAVVGGGEEESIMRRFCRDNHMENRLTFVGFINRKQVVKILNASDIFVLSSYSEGFPMVILEAMAAGLPIVATKVGAIPEIIEDGINGFLVRIKDADELCQKIAVLAANKHLRLNMGNENIARVAARYSIESVAQIFDKTYREILDQKSDQRRHDRKIKIID